MTEYNVTLIVKLDIPANDEKDAVKRAIEYLELDEVWKEVEVTGEAEKK